MSLGLYADECVDARIVAGLRRRGVDVTTAADQALLGAGNEQHLIRASDLGRTIVTADQDFLRMAHERIVASVAVPGLVFIQPGTRVGEVVRAIALLAQVLDPADMVSWIEWVP